MLIDRDEVEVVMICIEQMDIKQKAHFVFEFLSPDRYVGLRLMFKSQWKICIEGTEPSMEAKGVISLCS